VAESTRYLPLLRVLSAHGVEFILVGGLAAVLQGAPIITGDLDVESTQASAATPATTAPAAQPRSRQSR
jgi:hypothetical protein